MSNALSWTVQMLVRDGRLDDARALMAEMVESTRQEPGTTRYEWFLNDDGHCHILESYEDSAGALTHLSAFGTKFADRFMECFEPTAVFVYGEPSDEVREILDGFGSVYLGTFGGFSR